jgi:hypothetical protein
LGNQIHFVRPVMAVLAFTFATSGALATTIGDGDIYSQPPAFPGTFSDLTLLPGGTIVAYDSTDPYPTFFVGGEHRISGGTVNDDLWIGESVVLNISGGTFNNELLIDSTMSAAGQISGGTYNELIEIDRQTAGSSIFIDGGTYNRSLQVDRNSGQVIINDANASGCDDYGNCGISIQRNGGDVILNGGTTTTGLQVSTNTGIVEINDVTATGCGGSRRCGLYIDTNSGLITINGGTFGPGSEISRLQGDVIFRGGLFDGVMTGSISTGNPASTTFEGYGWTLDNAPLVIPEGGSINLNGQNGILSGYLADGNSFAVDIYGLSDATLTVVNVVPIPGAVWLFASALAWIGWRRSN